MQAFERIIPLIQALTAAGEESELVLILEEAARYLGFQFFALTHHIDVRQATATAIHLHNYPDPWVEYYEENALGVSDPVHRGAHVTSVGFVWSQLPRMIELTRGDYDILGRGEKMGIGDGFTVPAHVPGESNGSCSFANPRGVTIDADNLAAAQLVGAYAFDAARRICRVRVPDEPPPRLTDRQRECLVWSARGKSDWEISRILGVQHETVVFHMKEARERYGVPKRTMLLTYALFDGSITFADVLKR